MYASYVQVSNILNTFMWYTLFRAKCAQALKKNDNTFSQIRCGGCIYHFFITMVMLFPDCMNYDVLNVTYFIRVSTSLQSRHVQISVEIEWFKQSKSLRCCTRQILHFKHSSTHIRMAISNFQGKSSSNLMWMKKL